MAPVIHCSLGDLSIFPRTTFIPRRDVQLTRFNVSGKYTRLTSYSQRLLLHQSSLGLFQFYRSGCVSKHGSRIQIVAAVGTNVTVEEPNPAVSGEGADETLKSSPNPAETSETTPANPAVTISARSKRPKTVRKSEMPPLKDEELLPGASFTGKVRSIQPFGAFVDIGAYTDGLVHVSRMSDGYVKDVSSVVSVGQEVKVIIVEANKETGRISLTMRDSDDTTKTQQRQDAPSSGSSDKPRPVRKNSARPNQKRDQTQKSSKFVKGQVLDGTVKNLTRSGAFVSFPDGEEGFLPVSEESEGLDALLGNSSLQVGQEVNVRVLRITRGQATLTMKKDDVQGSNVQVNQGVVHVATNPFELAFRKNKDISGFLEERERAQKASENLRMPRTSELIGEKVDETITKSDALDIDGSTANSDENQISASAPGTVLEDDKTTSEELHEEIPVVDSVSTELVSNGEESVKSLPQIANAVLESLPEDKKSSRTFTGSSSSSSLDEVSVSEGKKDFSAAIKTVQGQDGSSKAFISEEESSASLGTEKSVTSVEFTDSMRIEEPNFDSQSSGEIDDQILSSKGVVTEEVYISQSDGTLDNEAVTETKMASSDSKDVEVKSPEESKGQTGSPVQGGAIKATISPALVKQLREETGAGMMDCKKALAETGGDIIKAQEFLRKKGLASADKKASRATAEGRVGSYIHDNRIGVLIEVNCETDFVSRGELFKQLVDDLAMQVAACPQVCYLATDDVPEEIVNKERDIEMQKEDLITKPEPIRSKIVDGRIRKRLEEISLLEQPYIKNDKVVVKDLVKQTIATIGENIKVKRFARYNLGEGLQRKSQDFAAEVAAQTAANPSPATSKDQSVETNDTTEKPPAVAVSAMLVKQLREETGAGMMDCKKALTETEGDLEKAQEYLRKKGLSSADKKSSRLAAEGRISSYIHDSRIGVLIEVNCETDFVARNEKFRELADDLAMQAVAYPQVEFVSVEDIPGGVASKEKEIEMQREDLKSKPEHIREKIVEGRISKRLCELALLEQPFIKDDSVMVKDLVKQTVAALGENIRVRRFVRYTLGEGED